MQFIPNSPIPPSGMISKTLLTFSNYSTLRGFGQAVTAADGALEERRSITRCLSESAFVGPTRTDAVLKTHIQAIILVDNSRLEYHARTWVSASPGYLQISSSRPLTASVLNQRK